MAPCEPGGGGSVVVVASSGLVVVVEATSWSVVGAVVVVRHGRRGRLASVSSYEAPLSRSSVSVVVEVVVVLEASTRSSWCRHRGRGRRRGGRRWRSWSWLNEPSWSLSGDNKARWSSSSRWLKSPVDWSSSTTTWSWLSCDEDEELRSHRRRRRTATRTKVVAVMVRRSIRR